MSRSLTMKNKPLILFAFIFSLFIGAFISPASAAEGTFLTDEKTTMRLYPESDEGTNNWTATTSCPSTHWDCVNETSSDGDTTYIETSSASADDRFNVQDIPWSSYPISSSTAANQILRIELYMQAKDPSCSPSCGSISAKIKNSSTMYAVEATTTKTLTGSYAEYWFVWTLKPPICSPTCDDTQPWTLSDINNIVVSPYCVSGTCRVTQVEARVVWQRMARSAWLTAANTAGVLRKTSSGMHYSAFNANNVFVNGSPDWDATNYTSGSMANGTGIITGLWKRTGSGASSNNDYLGQVSGNLRTSFVTAIASTSPATSHSGVLRFRSVDSNDYLQAGIVFQSGDEALRIALSDNATSTIIDKTITNDTLSPNTFYLITSFYNVSADQVEAAICQYDLVLRRCASTIATSTASWTNTYDENAGSVQFANGGTSTPAHVGMAQICSAKTITIAGLPDNYSARLYDDSGNLTASSTETTGNRTIVLPDNVPCVQYFSTINIYDNSSLLIYQTHISNDIAGGDVWQWVSNESILLGPVVSMIDETTASIWAKGVKNGTYRVKYRLKNSLDSWVYSGSASMASSTRFTGAVQLTGLTASTTYEYQPQMDYGGGFQDEAGLQYFKTACQAGKACSYSFTFGSCKRAPSSPFGVLCRIKNDLNPDFNMEIGDIIYLDTDVILTPIQNNEDSKASAESKFIDVWLSQCFKSLASSTPYILQRDDHEDNDDPGRHNLYPYHMGIDWDIANDSGAIPRFESPTRSDITKEMNGYYWYNAVPDSLKRSTAASDGYEYAFSYGDSRFILPDVRWYRTDQWATDDSGKSLFGSAQKTWLIDQIQNPPAGTKITFMVLTGATKYATSAHNGSNNARTYKSEDVSGCGDGGLGECGSNGYTTDMQAVWDAMCRSDIPVVILSGDAHIGAITYRTDCQSVSGTKWSGIYDIRSGNLSQPSFTSSGEGSGADQWNGNMYLMVDASSTARHVAKVSVDTNYKYPKVFVDFYKYNLPANGLNGQLTLAYSRELGISEIAGLRATSTLVDSPLQQKIIRRSDGFHAAVYASSSTSLWLEVSNDINGRNWSRTPIQGGANGLQLCGLYNNNEGASVWYEFNRLYYICNKSSVILAVGDFADNTGKFDNDEITLAEVATTTGNNRMAANFVFGTDGYGYVSFTNFNGTNYNISTRRTSAQCSAADPTGCITGTWDSGLNHVSPANSTYREGLLLPLPSGKMLLTWRDGTNIIWRTCNSSCSTSGNWSATSTLASNASTSQKISLTSDSAAGFAWLAYSDGANIIAYRFNSSSNTWDATATISSSGANPSITAIESYIYISDIESSNILKVYRCKKDITSCGLYRSLTGSETLYNPQLSRQPSSRGAALLFAEKGSAATSNQYRLSAWPVFSEWGNKIYDISTPAKIMGQSLFNIQSVNGIK